MSSRIKGIIILAVLVGCIVAILPTLQAYRPGNDPAEFANKVNLGLDLQGGMYLDLEVQVEEAVNRTLDDLATSIEDALLDELVDYVAVERVDQAVEVQLASGENVNLNNDPYARLLSRYDLEQAGPDRYLITMPEDEVQRLRQNAVRQAVEVIRTRVDALGVSEPSIQRQGQTDILVQLPGVTDREQAIEAIGTQAVLEFYLVVDNVSPDNMSPAEHTIKYEVVRDEDTDQVRQRIPYVLERRAVLSGETVTDARVQFSSQDNTPYVSLSFNATGTERFANVTRRNRGRRLAIVMDDRVRSAPVIREAITGGTAQITGQFTLPEATQLAIVLRSGSLPAPLEIREERTVGASLGEDSIRQGVLSLLIGGLIVMAFMIVYYRLPGGFACFALVFNLLLIMVALAGLGATLTLPGIAGIVLTMGMSVDANVLIFERIREEVRTARNVRGAIQEGFGRAFWTIVDANITTLVAAGALLMFGSGPIRGFAVTLTIGILASMFTAMFVTRYLFELFYLSRRRLSEIRI